MSSFIRVIWEEAKISTAKRHLISALALAALVLGGGEALAQSGCTGPFDPAHSVRCTIGETQRVNVDIDIENAAIETPDRGQFIVSGVYVHHLGAAGDLEVDIRGGSVETHLQWAYGFEIQRRGEGAVKVDLRDVEVKTAGRLSDVFYFLESGEVATVIRLEDSAIQATGNQAMGISFEHSASGAGDVDAILRDTTIETGGTEVGAYGIFLSLKSPDGGDITVDMKGGGVTTTGATSYGIYAEHHSGEGAVEVDLENAAIQTMGDRSHGVFAAKSVGANGQRGDVDVDVQGGAITTAGDAAYGIYATHNGLGDVSIRAGGAITTADDNAYAVYAVHRGTGDIAVTLEDAAIQTMEVGGHGVYVWHPETGAIDVEVRGGEITTAGMEARALDISQTERGDVAVTLQDVAIRTTGNNSHAVEASTWGRGDVAVTVRDAAIRTTGAAESHAIFGRNQALKGQQGEIVIDVQGGSVETAGAASHGIYAANDGSDDVSVDVRGGSITTAGGASHGIYAPYAGTGDVAISVGSDSSGTEGASGGYAALQDGAGATIGTAGGASHGIYAAHSGSGEVGVVSHGAVETMGENAHGIYASHTGETGGVTVDGAGGSVKTARAGSHGIYAARQGAGNVGVTIGSANTAGTASHAIYATLTGAGDIDVASDSVETMGEGSHGIYVDLAGAGDIDVASGAVTTAGANSYGIYATLQDAGNINVVASGAIETKGAGAHGIYATLQDAGNINVVASGAIETKGAGAHGIYATLGGAGAMMVRIDGGSVRASGAGSHGVQLGGLNADTGAVEGAAAVGADGYRRQSVVVNGAVFGGAGAGVYLAGGGRVEVGPAGSVGAASGVAIHAAGDAPALLLEMDLDGRRLAETIHDGVVRNEGGATTIFVNGVKLHDGKTGATGLVAGNGLRDIHLAASGAIAGREFSLSDFTEVLAPRVGVYQVASDMLLRIAEGLDGERIASPGSPVWARASRGKGAYALSGAEVEPEYDADHFEAEAGLSVSFSSVKGLTGAVSVRRADAAADVKSPLGAGEVEAEGLGLGLGLSYKAGGYYLDGRFSVMAYDVAFSSDLRGEVGDADATSHSVGLEAGRRFALGKDFSLTPRAWLVRSRVSVDDLTDAQGTRASFDDAERLQVGGGVAAELSRKLAGGAREFSLRGSVDYGRTLDGTETKVTLAGETFKSAHEKSQLRLGLGGRYRWGRFTLEAAFFAGGVGSDDRAHSGRLTVGVRF